MSKKKHRKEKEMMKNTAVVREAEIRPLSNIEEVKSLPAYKVLIILGMLLMSGLIGFLFSGAIPFLEMSDAKNASAVSLYSLSPETVSATASSSTHVYFFGREDCQFCKAEKKFMATYLVSHPDVKLEYYDIIKDTKAKEKWIAITTLNGLPHVAPLTLVGGMVIQGYGGDDITGKEIVAGIAKAQSGVDLSLSDYEAKAFSTTKAAGCDESGTACGIDGPKKPNLEFDIPFMGKKDLKDFSMFSLSAILGFIDGFNPCALWVLITFLIALMQIGSRKKMFYVAGLFLFAEAIMYYLILTAWYKTWDFVGLDQIVTPLVGLLALGSGLFFLYRWKKATETVVCDITDIEEQEKIASRIEKIAREPLTIISALAIIGIALSVNIIEFACSIGIPQVFTKMLELNNPSFWQFQGYMGVYMLGYMADDIVVFGFALYGINKIHQSEKYSKLSLLIGGALMLLLGALLTFFPTILIL